MGVLRIFPELVKKKKTKPKIPSEGKQNKVLGRQHLILSSVTILS